MAATKDGSAQREVAQRVAKKELNDLASSLLLLRSIYPDDSAFRTAFTEKIIRTTDSRNNRVVRFILCAIEKHLSHQAHDFASDTFNIEHILPQNAADNWGGIGKNDAQALVYRLGNLTLLRASENRSVGNEEYARKRQMYQQSSFAITKKLGDENADWTPDRIAARQNWMATQATSIWRIAQFN